MCLVDNFLPEEILDSLSCAESVITALKNIKAYM